MLSVLSGLVAGTIHVISGPDHLAAITPIALEDPRRAAGIGMRWGLGHGLGAVSLGVLGLLTRSLVDIDQVSAWAELGAGLTLLVIGAWALRRVFAARPQTEADAQPQAREAAGSHPRAALLIGTIHGAAGTSHLLGVLPSLGLARGEAVAYLAAYLLAAVATMTGFGALMGRWAHAHRSALRATTIGASGLAILVGIVWIARAWPGT